MAKHRSTSGHFEIDFDVEADRLVWTCSDPKTGVEVMVRTGIGSLDPDSKSEIAALEQALAAGAPNTGPLQKILSVMPRRAYMALDYVAERLVAMARWTLVARETTNLTYPLTPLNERYLGHLIANVTGASVGRVLELMREPAEDAALHADLDARSRAAPDAWMVARHPEFGRRVGWYALVRLLHPAMVVEAGVDKGLGASLLCRALDRNAAEGHSGRYVGIDINPAAGSLFGGPWSRHGRIEIGDSRHVLAAFDRSIDLFISDSDHDPAFEATEYEVAAAHLSDHATIVADNAHVSVALARFAEEHGWCFHYLREEPDRHWYPGASIAIARRKP